MNKNHESSIIVVVGPTASGKSDFAITLALQHNGEIISADSRQVYKGLDLGTGKITKKETKGVPHHMLDVYELDEEVSVARYARDATPILRDILSRGKTPIICGGTGQYIDALIYDSSLPKVPPNTKLREEFEKKNTEELFELLQKKDSVRAGSVDKHNRVRIIRALEIVESLGVVPQQKTPALIYQTTIYLMSPTRELLRTRITARLEKRLKQGMLEEVKEVLEKAESLYGQATSNVIRKFGLEYVTLSKYLDGTLTEESMKKELITKSMQYAKRQQTWNKKYLPFATIVEVKE